MNRINWLIATGGNPCFGLEALIPILTPLIGETAAGIAGPALVGGAETALGGAALGGITGGGQGALRGAEVGGLTGAGIFGGGPAATALGLPATVGTTAGGVVGGALGGEVAGQNPLVTGAVGGLGGLGTGLSGIGATPAAPAATAAPTTAPMPGPGAVTLPNTGIQSYSDQLGVQGGLPGPQGINPTVQSDIIQGALPTTGGPTDGTQPALAGASSPGATLSPPPGGGSGGPSGAAPVPGDPGSTDVNLPTGQTGQYAPGSSWQTVSDPSTIAELSADPNQAAGAYQAAGGAPGGFGSGIMNFLGNPSGLQLAGAGLSGVGLLSQLANRNPYQAQINQLQQQGTGAATMATALESPTFTGIMPPGVQQAINQEKADAKAAITGAYARAGTPGSTSEAQQIAAENARIDASKIGIAQKMMDQAAGYASLAPRTLQTALADQAAQDQQLQNALARFAAALAGGRGGTTQPNAQVPSA